VNELVGIITGTLTSVGILIGAASWMMKGVMQPMKNTMEAATKAIAKNDVCLEKHSDLLNGHEIRIVKIETTHELRRCTDGDGA
jgi:hypothetical protein